MGRLILSFCFLMLSVSSLHANPSMQGRRGILRTLSGRTAPMADLWVNLHGEYVGAGYPLLNSGDWHHYPKLHTGITYGILDFLEFSVLGNFYGKIHQSDVEPNEFGVGLENAQVGLKLGGPLAEDPEKGLAWVEGVHLFSDFTAFGSPATDTTMTNRGFYSYVPHYPDVGADLLTDLAASPLNLQVNVGYFWPNNPRPGFSFPNERMGIFRWGVGVEIEAGPYVRLLTEIMGRRLIDRVDFPPDTVWITPGIRFLTPAGVVFDLGCDFALSGDFDWIPDRDNGNAYHNENAYWNGIVGISIVSSLRPPPPVIATGVVAGKVSDSETGEGLGAEITFPGTSYEAINSDPMTGLYKISLKPGIYRIHVSKDGYLWKEKPVTLKKDKSEVLDFELSKKHIPQGIITGKVTDVKTGRPVGAKLSFPDTKIPSASSDIETGIYKATTPPGTYSVKAEAEGYVTETLPVVVTENETSFLNFKLVEKGLAEGIITGKVTDAKTDKPVGARVSFPNTNIPSTSSDIESGIYKTTAPPGTYSVRAEAEGYAPETLPAVLVENQTSFLNFKLHPKLVVGERIILRGINFDTGSATIRPGSHHVLDDAARVLKANPGVRIEIQGHTDSVGSADYNQNLSEARAQSVRSYLISVGIGADRLIARGYGESMPMASNRTSAGRQLNRRIEFLILSK